MKNHDIALLEPNWAEQYERARKDVDHLVEILRMHLDIHDRLHAAAPDVWWPVHTMEKLRDELVKAVAYACSQEKEYVEAFYS